MVNATQRKYPVGAHYGLADWLAQRITAVVMIIYTLGMLGIFMWHGGMQYDSWAALFERRLFKIATFLFMVALVYHTWVGMRNITMDYVKPIAIRLTVQTAIVFTLIGYLGWTIGVLWG